MSIPTLTDPALSSTNDASVVENNDKAIQQSVMDLDKSTNIVAYKGIKVLGAAGMFKKGSIPGTFTNSIYPRQVDYFLYWDEGELPEYLDISAYALGGSLVSAYEPASVTVTLERSSAVAGTYAAVGSSVVLNSPSLETYTTVDLTAVAFDPARRHHRIKVQVSEFNSAGDSSWQDYPVFVVVNVRLKTPSY